MSQPTLTKTKMTCGVWQGIITGAREKPELSVTFLNTEIPGISISEAPEQGMWHVELPIPAQIISDGVQTLLISDSNSGATLASITLSTGEVLEDDLRAEVDLLRAEIDMLKSSFRRHCRETG